MLELNIFDLMQPQETLIWKSNAMKRNSSATSGESEPN